MSSRAREVVIGVRVRVTLTPVLAFRVGVVGAMAGVYFECNLHQHPFTFRLLHPGLHATRNFMQMRENASKLHALHATSVYLRQLACNCKHLECCVQHASNV